MRGNLPSFADLPPALTVIMIAGGGNTQLNGAYRLAYSFDGTTWYGSDTGNEVFTSTVYGLASNGSMWTAVGGASNRLAYSINGISWYPSSSGNAILSTAAFCIASNGSIWVACGWSAVYTSAMCWSSDGINWTVVNNIFLNMYYSYLWDIKYSTDLSLWIAVGSAFDGVNNIYASWSENGIDWYHGTGDICNEQVLCMAFGQGFG